jgi:hypothetical protein
MSDCIDFQEIIKICIKHNLVRLNLFRILLDSFTFFNFDFNLFRGATEGATLVLHLGAIIVAFVSSVSFLNSSIAFLAALVGIRDVSFEWILGYHLHQGTFWNYSASR